MNRYFLARLSSFALFCGLLLLPSSAELSAQYFGRNKIHYEDFGFQVMKSEHFDVFYYPEEEQAARDGARMAERWYDRLSRVLDHSFSQRKPIIFYANHGDFAQTTVVDEIIEEGTGGFTEPLQDRVVLPFTGSYAANDHVIGHELVHAFQYDMVQRAMGNNGLPRMSELPLWFVEGMAEYLSSGRYDPNTAMWMRDAVLRDKIPTLDQMTRDGRYFPYRYGQAVWAYIAGRWGDEMIVKLYRTALVVGWEAALKRMLGITEEELSRAWRDAMVAAYSPQLAGRVKPADAGRRLLFSEDDEMSTSPAVSPDGRWVAFLSSRDLFSIDLYLADAQTGKVVSRLLSSNANPHLDAIRFINSAGSWSPDGRKIATVVYSNGNDQLAIIDVAARSVERSILLKDIGEITSPSFSPDGKQVVFSGSRGGVSDLYILELATNKIRRLTDDRNADFQPVWSPDGATIAFSTDRGPETDFIRLSYSEPRLALYDLANGTITVLPRFAEGKNINPQYSPDGTAIYFVADRDGFSDIYRYTVAGGAVVRVTKVATGISGIASGSPALSVARTSGRLMYSVFSAGSYSVYWAEPAVAPAAPADSAVAEFPTGGLLPPPEDSARGIVARYLVDYDSGLPGADTFATAPYSPALRLTYLGAPTVGASVSSYGAFLTGGISAYFSDMLGYHQLATTLQMNGSFEDIGAEVQYLYTKNRWDWGARGAHIPNALYGRSVRATTYEPPGGQPVQATAYDDYTQRILQDEVGLIGIYPFTSTRRFEMNVGYTRVGFSLDVLSRIVVGNTVVAQTETELPSPDALNLLQASTALVGDNSSFGYTSPIAGQRYRLEVGGTAGSLRFGTLLLDYRKYFFVRPVTFAVRGYHFGRYGGDAESDLLTPLFLGYGTNVRGYESSSFIAEECTPSVGGGCPEFDRLIGSRIALASAEVRAPLFGTRGYGLINAQGLPIEIGAFVDAGLAWSPGSNARIAFETNTTDRVPVVSAGFNARMNMFGYFVLEVYYARPFQRPNADWQWGFNFTPGW